MGFNTANIPPLFFVYINYPSKLLLVTAVSRFYNIEVVEVSKDLLYLLEDSGAIYEKTEKEYIPKYIENYLTASYDIRDNWCELNSIYVPKMTTQIQ